MTQESLASAAGLSVDAIRKLEQGRRRTARLTSINALARALDTEPSHLVGQPTTFEANSPDDVLPSVLALRQAVSPVADLLVATPTLPTRRASLTSGPPCCRPRPFVATDGWARS